MRYARSAEEGERNRPRARRLMKLIDLIDYEAQLAWDRDVDPSRLAARDAAIGRELGQKARDEAARAVPAWLGALREGSRGRAFPGRPVTRALRALSAALLLVGFAAGFGLAEGILAYDGTRPVNVMDFLWVVVGVQLVLLVFLALALAVPRWAGALPLVGDVRALVAWAYPKLASRLGGERSDAWAAAFHRLRSRRSLYSPIEPWILLGLTQLFGVAFNLGVILGLVRLVALTDLAFAWATTLEMDAASLHGALVALSRPWSWAFPEAAPSLALVEATRYSRHEGAYLGGGGPVVAGGWWPFLLAATITYGLAPRLSAWTFARVMRARRLASVRLDDVESRRLLARLTAPQVEIGRTAEEPEAAAPDDGALPRLELGGSCAVVLFRDVPLSSDRLERAVRGALGAEVSEESRAGGLDAEADRRALASVGAAGVPVLLVAEAWEAPDKGLLRFLRELRSAIAPRTPIVVGLVGVVADGGFSPASEEEVRLWSERVASLGDPHLGVERLEPSS